MKPTIVSISGVGGAIEPAPSQPRWLAYGDSIAEGWIASGPGRRVAGNCRAHVRSRRRQPRLRRFGPRRTGLRRTRRRTRRRRDLDHARHQLLVAHRPFRRADVREHRGFPAVVRAGHPGTPIVVASPIVRPDGETTPNKLGATHAEIRDAMEREHRT